MLNSLVCLVDIVRIGRKCDEDMYFPPFIYVNDAVMKKVNILRQVMIILVKFVFFCHQRENGFDERIPIS